jgi:hypothetical protein
MPETPKPEWKEVMDAVNMLAERDRAYLDRLVKYTFSAIGIVAAVVLAAGAYFYGKSLNEAREGIRVIAESEFKREVNARINAQFDTPQIRQLVAEKAQEFTASRAAEIIQMRVDQGLAPFRDHLTAAEQRIAKSVARVDALDRSLYLAEEATLSRSAYDRLKRLSEEAAPAAAVARQRLIRIQIELAAYQVSVPPGTAYDAAPSGASIQDLFAILNNPKESVERRRKIVWILWQRAVGAESAALKERQRQILIESAKIFNTSDSLHALAAVGALLRYLQRPEAFPTREIEWLDFDSWKRYTNELLK